MLNLISTKTSYIFQLLQALLDCTGVPEGFHTGTTYCEMAFLSGLPRLRSWERTSRTGRVEGEGIGRHHRGAPGEPVRNGQPPVVELARPTAGRNRSARLPAMRGWSRGWRGQIAFDSRTQVCIRFLRISRYDLGFGRLLQNCHTAASWSETENFQAWHYFKD